MSRDLTPRMHNYHFKNSVFDHDPHLSQDKTRTSYNYLKNSCITTDLADDNKT